MKLIIFKIGDIFFGLDIMIIAEVISYQSPQIIPNAPPFVEGVLNFREKIVPLVDLRKRFAVSPVSYNFDTKIIIFTYTNYLLGVIIDDAKDVLTIKENEILPRPDYLEDIKTEYITGFVRTPRKTIVILNLENVLSSDENIELNMFQQLLTEG